MPFPNFDPVLVHIGPIAIRWYALAYIAGIILGWRYAVALARNPVIWKGARPTLDSRQIDDFVLWVTLAILIGGRLGSILFYNTSVIWTDPIEILKPWHGGMSFHGALLAVVGVIFWFAHKEKIDVVRLGDFTAPCVPFGLFFGRVANFVNGELWGRPTHLPWGIIFPRAGPEPRHPSELYEAGLEGIVLFLILRWATHGGKLLPRRGAVVGLFLFFYGLFRISLENVREPDVGMPIFPFGLTMGIILSIPMVLVGLGFIYFSMRPGAVAPLMPILPDTPPDPTPDNTVRDVSEVSADTFPAPTSEPLLARPAGEREG